MASSKTTARADDRRTLKVFLTQYYVAKKKKAILQNRLRGLRKVISSGSEDPLKIEARIRGQAEEAERDILEIMDILDCLPADSLERSIMELRHIDCKTWQTICTTVYLSRASCFRHYNKGLDALLKNEKVRNILGLSK